MPGWLKCVNNQTTIATDWCLRSDAVYPTNGYNFYAIFLALVESKEERDGMVPCSNQRMCECILYGTTISTRSNQYPCSKFRLYNDGKLSACCVEMWNDALKLSWKSCRWSIIGLQIDRWFHISVKSHPIYRHRPTPFVTLNNGKKQYD